MAVTYGFFDAINSDRLYNAEQFNDVFKMVIETEGILEGEGTEFLVEEDTGMNITVDSGLAWFFGTWTRNDAQIGLTVAAADPTNDRIDYVVLEVDKAVGVRACSIKMLTGTPAGSPVPPTLADTSTLKQMALAEIYVDALATTIHTADITNLAGGTEAPYIAGLLRSEIDALTTLIQGYESEWGFDGIFPEVTPPASPTSGNVRLYAKTDGKLYSKDDVGAETLVSGGLGGSPLTTKGDVYTYSTTETRLAVGTNSRVLTAASSQSTGLLWAQNKAGVIIQLVEPNTACTTGLKVYFQIPSQWSGWNIAAFYGVCVTAGTTGSMTISVERWRSSWVEVCSSLPTFNSGVASLGGTYTINTSNDDLLTNDLIGFTIDTIHTTPAIGLSLTMEVYSP